MQCDQCQKPISLCVCDSIEPQPTQLHVLILQHPQEPDHEMGTALLAHLALLNSTLKIGLSWRSLNDALGRKEVNASRWAVLYLGSGVKSDLKKLPPLQFVSKKGVPTQTPNDLEGIVLLDGSWSQAKTLWWRNPWLLKLKRAILTPQHASLYGKLRREPRRECLSTIEATAEILELLGEKPEVAEHLRILFKEMLERSQTRRV